ncbi:MAG: hypothetical protein GC191_16725 [Azospirillum sp.]|nr:hypothetical protein [Azospirillum sp.]
MYAPMSAAPFAGAAGEARRPQFLDLSTAGQFAVWAARAWSCGHRRGETTCGLVVEAFVRAEVGEAWQSHDHVMTLLAHAAERPPQFGCPRMARLTPDEGHWLAVLSGAQHGGRAGRALERWLSPAAVWLARPAVEHLAKVLVEARLILPSPRLASMQDALFETATPVVLH